MKRTIQRVVPDEAMVRIGATIELPDVVRGLGQDPSDVLSEMGLDAALFDDPDNLISFKTRSRLIAVCVERTGCAHFGLLLGQRMSLRSFGLVGELVKRSPDVGAALRSFVRYMYLHVRGAALSLSVHGDVAMLGYAIHQRGAEAAAAVGDGAMAAGYNIMRELCGEDWVPAEVLFAHRRPRDAGPYRRFFRAPLRFDAEEFALAFPSEWLSRPLRTGDGELRRLLQKQIDALEATHGDDFAEQVRRVLRTALLTNHAKADQVAALFSMHSRTLNRRLNAYGCNFQDLVDEVGFEIARQLLEDSRMDVTEVAAVLNYADGRAFARAFRRWSGTTPTLYRKSKGRTAGRSATPARPEANLRVRPIVKMPSDVSQARRSPWQED